MNDKEIFEYKLAWEWFKYHAKQRFQAFYIFILIFGALTYGFLISKEDKSLFPLISLLGALVSIIFYLMEIRNLELVQCGRYKLDKLRFTPRKYDKNRDALGVNWVNKEIEKKIKEHLKCTIKHEFLIRLVYIVTFCLSVIAFICSKIAFQAFVFVLTQSSALIGIISILLITIFLLAVLLIKINPEIP